MFLDSFYLALKNIRHRGLRSWLTLLGIIIGIAAVISLLSLGQGLQEAITGQFSGIAADRLVVTNAETAFGPPGSTAVKKLSEHDVDVIESVPGVVSTIPRLIRVTPVEYNRRKQFVFTGSLPQEQEQIDFIYRTFQLKAASGRLLKSGERGSVILGSQFATHFAQEEHFGKEIRVGTHFDIQGKDFEVAAILAPLSNFQFNNAIFIPEKDLKEILGIKDEIDLIVVKIADIEKSKETATEIARKMRKDRHQKEGEEDFSVQAPASLVAGVNTILVAINVVVSGIAAIALLIGAIGVSNTMFTSILERRKEIGIMKAVGARNRDVLVLFVLESGLLGLIGGVLGALTGVAIAFGAASAANAALGTSLLHASFSMPIILGSVCFTFLLGIIAGMIPAWQASILKPVEALRR
jgi:putative ABC transport system permease protein